MTYPEIVREVSTELGLPRDLVDKTYKAYWKCIKDTIKALPLKEDLTEEKFRSMKTSFSIPRIGKLAVIWDKYVCYEKIIKERLKKKNDKT